MSAVVVDGVSKRFRLFHEHNQSLKATVMRGRRARYEEFWALTDVSLEIPEGSTFGLIGPNGSGKSTLLKCLARILRPDHGEITVNGRVSALLELGSGFHPELSGRENVFLNGSILGLNRKEISRRFDEIVEFAGIEKFIDMPVKSYSSGMYVRLGFSVAINIAPDILIVDEVLSVGDAVFQKKCIGKFHEMREQGRTVILVSHSLATVRSLCDQAALLQEGQVVTTGPTNEVVDAYLQTLPVDMEAANATRLGTGAASIEGVRLIGSDGTSTDAVEFGEAAHFAVDIDVIDPLPDAIIQVVVRSLDGRVLAGSRTTGEVEGAFGLLESATVNLHTDRFPLGPGIYELSVTVTDPTSTILYDAMERCIRFRVERADQHLSPVGPVALGERWSISTRAAP